MQLDQSFSKLVFLCFFLIILGYLYPNKFDKINFCFILFFIFYSSLSRNTLQIDRYIKSNQTINCFKINDFEKCAVEAYTMVFYNGNWYDFEKFKK